jgi:hypothetical protein
MVCAEESLAHLRGRSLEGGMRVFLNPLRSLFPPSFYYRRQQRSAQDAAKTRCEESQIGRRGTVISARQLSNLGEARHRLQRRGVGRKVADSDDEPGVLKETQRQRAKKSYRTALAQAATRLGKTTTRVTHLGSALSNDNLTDRPLRTRQQTFLEVFCNSRLTDLQRTKDLINKNVVLRRRVVTGGTWIPSAPAPTPTTPTALPSNPPRLVDELFSGPAIPGRN